MTASRWRNSSQDLSKSFGGFLLKEQGQFIDGDPAEIAQQKGWTPDKFGWYRDGSGAVVARSIGGRMVVYDGQAQQAAKQVDMGNPTVASGMNPADRARSMGLQSDGKGGYRDQAGNMVARTVNNELVFYDDGASGGVVSDGGGGMQLTQSSPSWVDPVSGLILVPPAQPETPEELKSVPDPIPATPPQGYDSFITRRHLEKHSQAKEEQRQAAEEQERMQKVQETYGSNPMAQKFYQDMSTKIEAALGKNDEYMSDVASRAKQALEDRAEEITSAFGTVETDKHAELSTLLTKALISRAKSDWAEENMYTSIENDELLSDDEKREQRSLLYGDEKGKHWGSHYKHDNAISELIDGAEDRKNQALMDQEARNIEGEFVTYTLKRPNNDVDVKQLSREANKTLKNLDMKVTGIQEVIWNNNDEDQAAATDENGKRIIALDALRTWRQKVLPTIEPGTVLVNTPTKGNDNQRERIYQLAGFSAYNEKLGTQAGIVIDDDGEKRVIPLEGATNTARLKEGLCYAICESVDTLGSLLLEDYLK